jgi:hypothetical protein
VEHKGLDASNPSRHLTVALGRMVKAGTAD